MPTQPIPFTGSSKNSDVQFQNGINYTCRNGVVDELGNLNRRPGSSVFVDLGTSLPVTGLFYSSKQNVTVAISGREVFLVSSNGVVTNITGDGLPELASLVTFADFGDTVYCANGGQIIGVPLNPETLTLSDGVTDLWTDSPTTPGEYYYTGSLLTNKPSSVMANGGAQAEGTLGSLVDGEYAWGDQDTLGSDTLYLKLAVGDPDAQAAGYVTSVLGTTYYIADTSAPILVTHVAVLNQKLICNNKAFSARFQWSAVGLPEDWSDGYFATAEAQEDGLLFLSVADERVVLGGENTFEFWRDTGVIASTFVPESQEFTQRGTIAKHSPAYCRDRWIWVDEYKQLVMLNGRQAVPIPTQNPRGLTNFLQGLDLTDARGRFVVSAGKFYYLCQLPKAEKSFFYDIDKEEWLEASDWDEINAEDDLYRAYATTYAFGPNWGQMLIGDSRAGNIYCFDNSEYTDSTEIIRTVLETGYIDRGTSDNRKKTARLSGRLKLQNVTTVDPELNMIFQWRNENTHVWSERLIKLYKESNNQFRWSTSGLGAYYMRQYRFIVTADTDFIMSPPQETFEYVK